MATKSKLAAVMFTDIVNYSGFMAENEVTALSILDTHNSLLLPLIEKNEGKVIKSIGDALLVDFPSARTACECALSIQNVIADHDTKSDNPFFIRIGIHLGDIWYKDDDIFGAGVNITSRLEALAAPGGIVISEDVFNQINNKLSVKTRPLGSKSLKNIEQPVNLYEIITGHETIKKTGENPDPAEEIKRKFLDFADRNLSKGMRAEFVKEADKTDQPDDPADRVKKKIFTVVSKVMDKAVQEWEKQPEEKKQRIMVKIEEAADKIGHYNGWKSGGPPWRHRERRNANRIPVGIAGTIGFGAALVFTGIWWMAIPLTLIGLIPLTTGIAGLFRKKEKLPAPDDTRKKDIEKEILKLASRSKGKITALQAASETTLSIDEAKQTLDDLVKNGYASLEVEENGLLVYEFPELIAYKVLE